MAYVGDSAQGAGVCQKKNTHLKPLNPMLLRSRWAGVRHANMYPATNVSALFKEQIPILLLYVFAVRRACMFAVCK